MVRRNSLRGCMILKWRGAGSPESVRYSQVQQWATDCDDDLRKRGVNPATVFRGHLEKRDDDKARQYLRGERFPFTIIDDLSVTINNRQPFPSKSGPKASDGWRACLKCGRLNLVDAIYCSYCAQPMPHDIR